MRQNRKVILLAVAIAAFNQLSGINAILYYVKDIFRMAGAGDNAAGLQSVVVGLVNPVSTMVALTVIDRIGRKKLNAGRLDRLPGQPGCGVLRL